MGRIDGVFGLKHLMFTISAQEYLHTTLVASSVTPPSRWLALVVKCIRLLASTSDTQGRASITRANTFPSRVKSQSSIKPGKILKKMKHSKAKLLSQDDYELINSP